MDISSYLVYASDFSKNRDLGEGPLGLTSLNIENQTGKIYVFKSLITNFEIPSDEIRFYNYLNILFKLNHPCIIKLVAFSLQGSSANNNPILITPYYQLKSFQNYLGLDYLPSWWTPTFDFKFILGVSHAMKLIHSQNLLHGNLKPTNILISDNYEPCISEIAYSFISSEGASDFFSSPRYMAPEIFKGGPRTKATDVFSFGVLVFCLMTGRIPFEDLKKDEEVLQNMSRGYRPYIPDYVPKQISELIQKCWSYNVEERPSFLEICNKILDGRIYWAEADTNDLREFAIKLGEKYDPINKDIDKSMPIIPLENQDSIIKEQLEIQQKDIWYVPYYSFFFSQSIPMLPILEPQNILLPNPVPNIEAFSFENFSSITQNSMILKPIQINNLDVTKFEPLETNLSAHPDMSPKAIEFALKAKEDDDKAKLGFALHYGIGIDKDINKAKNLLENDPSNPKSEYQLVLIYQEINDNQVKMIELITKLAKNEYPPAQYLYGLFLLNGQNGITKSTKEGLNMIWKAASLGYPPALNQMGILRMGRYGIPENPLEASTYFKISAEVECPEAMINYGKCLSTGYGLLQNLFEAERFISKGKAILFNNMNNGV